MQLGMTGSKPADSKVGGSSPSERAKPTNRNADHSSHVGGVLFAITQ